MSTFSQAILEICSLKLSEAQNESQVIEYLKVIAMSLAGNELSSDAVDLLVTSETFNRILEVMTDAEVSVRVKLACLFLVQGNTLLLFIEMYLLTFQIKQKTFTMIQ